MTISNFLSNRKKAYQSSCLFTVDIQWPEHILIYTIPVRAAVLFNIPIIVCNVHSANMVLDALKMRI